MSKRLRLASLSEGFIYGYSRLLCKGIEKHAREIDADFVGITCATMTTGNSETAMRNILYDHIDASLYDGFIIPLSSLSSYVGFDGFQKKLKTVFAKPCVTIGGVVPDHPSIIPDWDDGMQKLVTHLVENHCCNRFLFLRGPATHAMSDSREAGLCSAMRANGLNDSMMDCMYLDFSDEAGEDVASALYAEKKLASYDALIFVSDSVAGAALRTLITLGVRIPEDIIICACTNAPTGKPVSPGLTTLDEDVVSIGIQAAGMLKEHIEGKKPIEHLKAKVSLVIRESCGCACSATDTSSQKSDDSLDMLNYFQLFRQLGFSLLSDNKLSEVFPLLHKTLGMEYCSISLFEKGEYPFHESRCMAKYMNGEAVYYGDEGPLFETRQFVPESLFDKGRMSILIEPLYYKDMYLGVFGIDFGEHNGQLYEVILAEFASAIYLILQHNRLLTAEKRFYDMAFTSSDWLWEIDPTGNISYSSGAVVELTGLKTENLVGTDFFSILLPQAQGQLDVLRKQMLISREPIRNQEVLSRTCDGTSIFFLLSGKPAFSASGSFMGYRGACRDITHSKNAEEQIRNMAYNDMLTGLPNRRLFMDRLETEFKKSRRGKNTFTLMFIDLDNFKRINDELGHEKGDELLREVAVCLEQCIRGSDTLARVGGDEFVFLLPPIQNRESATVVAERIMNNFRKRFEDDSEFKMIGASIGIALFPDDGDTLDSLIRNADEAMYKAKNAGKGGYCFYSADATEQRLSTSENKLNRRVPPLLVPVFDLADGALIGFRTNISPKEKGHDIHFSLRNATEVDEIEEVNDEAFALAQITDAIAHWNECYNSCLFLIHPVNSRGIANTEVFSTFMESLSSMHLPRELLYLSIAHNISAADFIHSVKALEMLSKQGYSLMLSGCSTTSIPLALFEKLHFSILGFMASDSEKANNEERFAVLTGLVTSAAKNIGANLFAEGITNDAQLHFFRDYEFKAYLPPASCDSLGLDEAERLVSKQKKVRKKTIL